MTPPDLLRSLRQVAGPDPNGPADAELLARFAATRDEAAFELLVWRHGGMVRRVCRARLRDHHAAEDAAQAVFLALARQAAGVGHRGSVAGWLFRVARRVAGRAARRRTAVAADVGEVPAPSGGPDPDLARVLHEELDRLPTKYREPVLLCYFEGLTQAAAARRLGWPAGTVATRVTRAREWLHRRLVGRGVTLPAAGLAGVLTADAAGGAGFVASTTTAAMTYTAGGAVPPAVLALVTWEVRVMLMSKVRWAVLLVAAGMTAGGGGVWMAGGQEPPKAAKPPAPEPTRVHRTPVYQLRESSVNISDLREALGLDIYKFEIVIPAGEKFEVVLYEQDAADIEPRDINRFRFQRDAIATTERVTLRLTCTRADGRLGTALGGISEEDMMLHIDCTGCQDRSRYGEVCKVPPRGGELPKSWGQALYTKFRRDGYTPLVQVLTLEPGPGKRTVMEAAGGPMATFAIRRGWSD